MEQPGQIVKPDQVERLILCSGKIAVDLQEEMEKNEEHAQRNEKVQILRIEQLYPLPIDEIKNIEERS